MRSRLAYLGLAAVCLSCTSSGEPLVADVAVAIDTSPAAPALTPGPVSMRRLTRAQYLRVVRDLFGEKVVAPELGDPDVSQGGLLSVGAADTTYSARGVSSIESAALSIAQQALADAAERARLVPCSPAGDVDAACSRRVVKRLGRLAWRRPLTDEEIERIAKVADQAGEVLGDFFLGLEYGVAALLQSPNFMFRVELGHGDGDDRRFDDFELASRLSFFLWNSTPDEALLDAAAGGALSTDDGLLAEATRLLDSPRSRESLRNFFVEQLTLYKLDALTKDPTLFEQFNTELGPDAREETLSLLLHTVFDQDSDFRDVLTTTQTYLNPRLAALYGLPAPAPTGFRPVQLPPEANRAGLLTHASVLNLQSHQTSSSATRRGKFVRTVLLCQTIQPPPVDVDTSIPEPSGTTLTLRDRVKEHLTNTNCAGCHSALDPIGLGLENYDAIGRWRTRDNGALIDPSGTLDGVPFSDGLGLGQAVRDHADFAPCVVQTLVRYATGHVELASEAAGIAALANRFQELGYRVRPLLLDIVMSPVFRRAGEPR